MEINNGINYQTAFRLVKVFLVSIISLFSFSGCNFMQNEYISRVNEEFVRQPLVHEEILTEQDIAHLPESVRKYIRYSGAIGKPVPQNVYIEFDAQMIKKPGAGPMESSSGQYNFFGDPARLFFMKSSMLMIPFRIFHAYTDRKATFVVRVASLFNAVDLDGEVLTTAETVTVLNDRCLFAPGSLADKRLSWKSIDSFSSLVIFENGPYKVSAILKFNDKGELVNFVSKDRYALQDDGTLVKAEWSTPVRDYKDIDGRKIPTYGEAIWHYQEGDFTYGKFKLRKIRYNVKGIGEK